MRYNKKEDLQIQARIFGLFSTQLILIIVIFLVSLFAFLYLANLIIDNNNIQLDIDKLAFLILNDEITPTGMKMMKVITFLGSSGFLIAANVFLFIYFLYFTKHRWYSIKVPVVALGSVTIMILLKLLFERPRPNAPFMADVSGFSFPSGHSMSAITFYGLLIFITWNGRSQKTRKYVMIVLLAILILLIGTSRVYLRVHYLSDVLAGFLMGFIWLLFSLSILGAIENYFEKKRKRIS